jgi:hypothetical protein
VVPAVRPADNPFASHRVDSLRFRFHTAGWNTVLEELVRTGGRGAVVGPHGSGKTTLLEQLASRIDGAPVSIRLDADTANPVRAALAGLPSTVAPGHAILVDGAEQLGPLGWWRFYSRARGAGTLVIASHRTGRLPTLYECSTDPQLLADLVRALSPETVDTVDLDELFHCHRGNIRLCFRELYDRWAGR